MDNEIYSKSGRGPDLIFLHGWKHDRHTWDGVLPLFEPHFRCWTVDMPGFGQNPKPNNVWKIDDYAKWVQSFMREHHIKDATLVGHSFGGRVAIVLTALEPEIKKLILVAAPGVKPNLPWSSKFAQALNKAVQKSKIPTEKLPFYHTLKKRLQSDDFKQSADMKDIFIATINFDLHPWMQRITVPTLLLWGEKDQEVPLVTAETMSHIIRDSTLHTIPDCGHVVHQEKPLLFGGIINSWLK